MTAEVAILNKSAVALAADSAVTISAGSSQQKIYDSADKLFELSTIDPIGIMVNGDMNFAQAPLPVLIKMFREGCPKFKDCKMAGDKFLKFLADFGAVSPDRVKIDQINTSLAGPFERIKYQAEQIFYKRMSRIFEENKYGDVSGSLENLREKCLNDQIAVMKRGLSQLPDAEFLASDGVSEGSDLIQGCIDSMIANIFDDLTDDQLVSLQEVAQIVLLKSYGSSVTGVVIAGFGSEELFPTLVSFELYGVIGNKLKFKSKDVVDIDREGVGARVMPFAQKEMVERFLYGLDESIRRSIRGFCAEAVPRIRERIFERLEMSEEDQVSLAAECRVAEEAFLDGLVSESFDAIQQESESEIEGMVEFMPKAELARMAEALVDLTSIKRRVTVGFETVGGPIDVAVISKSEGFIWVKRKHYFSRELNERFFARRYGAAATRGVTDA